MEPVEILRRAGLNDQETGRFEQALAPLAAAAPETRWAKARALLLPSHPITLHRALCDWAFQGWDEIAQGPRPIWQPDAKKTKHTNIAALMQANGLVDYDALFDWSLKQGRQFWSQMLTRLGIRFGEGYTLAPQNIVDMGNPETPYWFKGAKLNIAQNCFLADPDATAVIFKREGQEGLTRYSYADLDRMSNRVASALVAHGYTTGDRIAVDLPMDVNAVAIYLGIVKMGGVVICLADSFKTLDVEIRLEVAKPVKAIFTADATGGARRYPLYSTLIDAPHCPPAIVLSSNGEKVKLLRDHDIAWDDFLIEGADAFNPVMVDAEHPINILFSSSTSSPKEKEGDKPKPPKAIPWKAHTALKSAIDAHLHHDMQPEKVLCWPTNLGWMMGSFAIFAAFMNKGTLAIYDGNVVNAKFCKFIEEARVNVLGLVPSIAEGWEMKDMTRGCDWSRIECFSSTGSPSNPQNYFYLMGRVPGYAPVIEYMGGTEIGGGYLTGTVVQPASPSCFTTPTLGTDVYAPDEDTTEAQKGEVFIVMRGGKEECPPMGLSTELLNFDHREKYFPRQMKSKEGYLLREHGDVIARYPNGFIASHGRSDDGMNINGIKTSSLDLENYIKDARIPGVKEVAAIAVRPPAGGEDLLVIYVVKDDSGNTPSNLKGPVRDAIKLRNPQLAKVYDVVSLDSLPLTASGKLRRRYLQDSYAEQLIAEKASKTGS